MPLIRKKTSKRGTTRHRENVKHKVAEHRKKAKKQARKDKAAGKPVQKKSKKDPGIPNEFPYKDRILAEVEEERRRAAAEKQRRKEEKRAVAADDDGDDHEKSPTPEDVGGKDGQGFDGIMSLTAAPISQNKDEEVIITERIPVFPGPLTLREVVRKADVVLHVVDARDPAAGISEALAEVAQSKLALLLNKADTVPRESLVQWLAHLRTSYTVFPFRVSSAYMPFEPPNKKAKAMPKDDALGLAGLWTYLDRLAETKDGGELVVAVTGVTNVGKSAVINSIVGSDVFSIYDTHTAASARGPSTTTSAQEVVVTVPGNDARQVRFIDTPGLQFVRADSLTDEERETTRARDILLRCRGRIDWLKDPLFAVGHIVAHADRQDMMLAYNLPAFVQGDVTGFLAGLARVSGLSKKRGMPDHAGAARVVLRDWCTGKLMRYSLPGAHGERVEDDGPVLESVRSKKELWRADVKLVRVEAGTVDPRGVEWDVSWDGEDEEESDPDGDEDTEELPARRPEKRRVSFLAENGKRRR